MRRPKLRKQKGPDIQINQEARAEDGSSISHTEQNIVVNIMDNHPWLMFISAIIIILTVIGTGYWLYTKANIGQPEQMSAILRVAVAGFAVNGDRDDQALGTDVAQDLALNVENALQELNLEFSHEVWGPERVGAVKGATREERAESAREIAKDVNADIVLYGIIDTSSQPWQITPEFYIGGESFADASEITGQHEFGDKFLIPGLGDNANRLALSSELANRSDILSRLFIGLAFYSTRNFDRAYTDLLALEEENIWSEELGGKQLLYLLLGNTKGRIEFNDEETSDFSEVKKWYELALDEDIEYARAYAGLGNVYFLEALEPIQPDDDDFSNIDMELLDDSIAHYKRASVSENQPASADIGTKVHFGLGQAYLMQSYADETAMVNPAITEYEAVITDYGDGENPRVKELAAEAHDRLGLIYEAAGDNETAQTHFQKSIELNKELGNSE